jgi:hypothetical protein
MRTDEQPGLLQFTHGGKVVATVSLTASEVCSLLNRAMNTWEHQDQPRGLLGFADSLQLVAFPV